MSHFFQLTCFCLLFKVSQLSDSFLFHVFDHIHIHNTKLVPIKAILLCEFFPSIFILATPVWMRWWSGGEQGGVQTSQKTWVLRGDQDGGSSGHLLGRRRAQVWEKATGDLHTISIFKETFPQAFTRIVKAKVFWPHSLFLSFIIFSSWKGPVGVESTRKLC